MSTTTSTRHVPVSLVIIALLVPLAVTMAAVVLMLSWLPDLPNEVISHWGIDGADGFAGPVNYPIVFGITGVLASVALGIATLFSASKGELTWVLKVLALLPLWLTVFLGIVASWLLGAQRVSSEGVDSPALPILVGFVVASALAVIGWFILPVADRPVRGAPSPAPTLPIAAGERVLWTGLATSSTALIVIIGGVALFATALVAVAIVLTGGRYWFLVFAPVLIIFLVISSFAWRVRVDQRGVEVRSIVGVPRFFIPLSKVESASVAEINPIGDFGGWGLRWGGGGRMGVVLHRGAALEVHRTDRRSLVVTIDRPEDAAAVVNGLVAQRLTAS